MFTKTPIHAFAAIAIAIAIQTGIDIAPESLSTWLAGRYPDQQSGIEIALEQADYDAPVTPESE